MDDAEEGIKAMTIIYVLVSVILGAVLGFGLAWVQGFVELRNLARTASKVMAKELVMAFPVAPEAYSREWGRGWNAATMAIAVDIERAGNKVLAWQIRKKIRS
jgi:NhaP-type Na+/H+ or K+/H+ antiporter